MPKPSPKTIDDKSLDDVLNDPELDDDDFGAGIDDSPNPKAKDNDGGDIDPDEDPELEAEPEEVEDPITLRSLLAERGYELPEDADEIEAFGNIFDNLSQRDQAVRQLQEQNRQYQQQLSWFLNQNNQLQKADQQQPEKTQVENELTKLIASRPEWKPSYLNFLERDPETGKVRVAEGADPALLQKYNNYIEWEREFDSHFRQDPNSFIFNSIQANPQFQDYFQQQIQQAVARVQESFNADRIMQQRGPYLFDDDPQGGRKLNQAGEIYAAAIQEAREAFGENTPAEQLDRIAWRAAFPYALAAQQAQQKPSPKETPSQSKARKQIQFQKDAAKKRANTNRRSKPKDELQDVDDMDKFALSLMEEAGIDPHARGF